jgi:hypothetical protein
MPLRLANRHDAWMGIAVILAASVMLLLVATVGH